MESSASDRNAEDAALNPAILPSQTVLCGLRIVPVRSPHYQGRRYVVELSTTSRARELRVYRTLDQLLTALEQFKLPETVHRELTDQLLETGACNLLNILI